MRLFASILAITFAILVIQMATVWIMLKHQELDFKKDVFTSYTQRLKEALDEGSRSGMVWNLDNVGTVLKATTDDRISGLILHDGTGNTVLTFGKTPQGIVLPPIIMEDGKYSTVERTYPVEDGSGTDGVKLVEGSTQKVAPVKTSFTFLKESPWYVTPSISKLYVGTQTDDRVEQGVVMPKYPVPVRRQDVVGTVTLYADANTTEVFGSVDVLSFSPMTYELTAMILRRMILALGITVPLALIVALIGARIIAHTVSRHARRVADILQAVAAGDYEAEVPDSSLRELNQISDSVRRLGSQLRSNERMRQQWVRGIAHDLNTPVAAMKISIEGSLDGLFPLDGKLLKRLKKENDELERRVASVMMLSAMEAPDFKPQMEAIDTLDFADEVVNSSLLKCGISLDVQLDSMVGDRRLLLIICRELLNNGSKYSPEGAALVWRILPGTKPYQVCMQVINHGQVSQDTLAHAFEPWFRGDTSRSQAGSGMGLSIVRQVMELHHGTVQMVQSGDHQVTMVLQW